MNKTPNEKSSGGFSLIELMVAMGILTVLMLMMTVLLEQIQNSWRYSESRISQFREARVAFDLISKNLGQASLNTYYDLQQGEDGVVEGYYRTSELHFETMRASKLQGVSSDIQPVGHAVFFQAPLGFTTNYRNLNNLFNGRGYFVGYGPDTSFRPAFITAPPKYRFRLLEFRPPAEANQVFADGAEERENGERQQFTGWFKQAVSGVEGDTGSFSDHLNPMASNILTLVVSPRDSIESGGSRENTASEIAENYVFDSNNEATDFEKYSQQVPPLVRLTMVAIDEAAGARFGESNALPDLIPDTLFVNTLKYDDDIAELSQSLTNKNVNFKIFSTMVMLRSAKWSVN